MLPKHLLNTQYTLICFPSFSSHDFLREFSGDTKLESLVKKYTSVSEKDAVTHLKIAMTILRTEMCNANKIIRAGFQKRMPKLT
jgi:hypothetical protein